MDTHPAAERAVSTGSGPGRALPALLLRRSWLILLFIVSAGLLTWLVARDDPKTYERTLTFAILPSRDLAVDRIPDAMRSLSQQNSQISGTIAAAVGADGFVDVAARSATGKNLGPAYDTETGVRPGSDVLTTRLRGPDRHVLAALGPVLAANTIVWVNSNMKAYRLELLGDDAPAGAVAPKPLQRGLIAAFLAALLAVAGVYAEAAVSNKGSFGRQRETANADVQVLSEVGGVDTSAHPRTGAIRPRR